MRARIDDVLLADEGQRVAEIAARVARHAHTVQNWLTAQHVEGGEGLSKRKFPGRPHLKGRQVEAVSAAVLEKSPTDDGDLEAGGMGGGSLSVGCAR
jgi:transposase